MYKLQKAELMQTLSIALGERLSQHISAKAEHNDGFHESSPSFSCFLTKLVTLNLDSVTRLVIEGEILELCKKHKIRNGERDLHLIKSCAWTVQDTFVEEMVATGSASWFGRLESDMDKYSAYQTITIKGLLTLTKKKDYIFWLKRIGSTHSGPVVHHDDFPCLLTIF